MRRIANHLILAFLGIWCVTPLSSQGELCQGSLGDNIFEEGDFGSGFINILQEDPGIAPGYNYTFTAPPNDGEYLITNGTALWSTIWPTWLLLEDNSPDPNGYMMIVNASFSAGVFYEQRVDDLCGNTLYEFSADVINMINSVTTGHLKPNVSFLIDGVEYYTSGEIPQNEEWLTVGFTFKTLPGQTELTLTLRNNAPGGIGNDLALDNISFRPCGPLGIVYNTEPDGIICEDQGFPELSADIGSDSLSVIQWQISPDFGMTWTDIPGATDTAYQLEPVPPGEYQFRFLYASSIENLSNPRCRIISEIYELRVVPREYLIVDTLCEGLSMMLGDRELDQTGVYVDTFLTAEGCDSILTIDLTIVSDPGLMPEIVTTAPSCPGFEDGLVIVSDVQNAALPAVVDFNAGSYTVPDTMFSSAGVHEILITDRFGCTYDGTVDVPEPIDFVITGIGDTVVKLGHSVYLFNRATDTVLTLTWEPETWLDCVDCLDPVATPLDNITYALTAESIKGCVTSRSISIQVERVVEYYAPNAFTPNFDGVNDYWGLYGDRLAIAGIAEVQVFDRWGGVLFAVRDIPLSSAAQLWDGTSNSEVVQPGVYTFVATFILADGSTQSEAGSITLIR